MKLKYGLSLIVGAYLIFDIVQHGLALSNGFVFLLFIVSLLGEYARNRRVESCKTRVNKEGYVQVLRNDIKRELEDEKREEVRRKVKEKLEQSSKASQEASAQDVSEEAKVPEEDVVSEESKAQE